MKQPKVPVLECQAPLQHEGLGVPPSQITSCGERDEGKHLKDRTLPKRIKLPE